MPDPIGSLKRRAALAACLVMACAAGASAQPVVATPPATPQFLSRYDVHLSANALLSDDDRFLWDTRFGGDFDFVDYVRGRLVFVADYQAVLGNEFQPFDPNQGNYTLAVGSSWRAGRTEFLGVLHHVSRHLGDRPKITATAWNELDARVLRQFTAGPSTVDVIAQVGKVYARANVDYSWTGSVDAVVRRPLTSRVAVFGRALGQTIGVTDEFDRGQQWGGRFEGGVRLRGERGTLELLGGFERVIDAHPSPFDRVARQWMFGGFRLVTN